MFQQYKQGLVNPGTGLQVLDPDSMTFAALFGNKDLVLWRDAVDVLSTDPYPSMAPSRPAATRTSRSRTGRR